MPGAAGRALWHSGAGLAALIILVAQTPVAAAQQGDANRPGTSVVAKSTDAVGGARSDAATGPLPAAEATAASVTGDAARSTFKLTMSAGVQAEIFTLPSPYRVIIDLPEISFQLPPATGEKSQGLVKTFRYGLFAEGKARVVMHRHARPGTRRQGSGP